jgi:hypothetical protein
MGDEEEEEMGALILQKRELGMQYLGHKRHQSGLRTSHLAYSILHGSQNDEYISNAGSFCHPQNHSHLQAHVFILLQQ